MYIRNNRLLLHDCTCNCLVCSKYSEVEPNLMEREAQPATMEGKGWVGRRRGGGGWGRKGEGVGGEEKGRLCARLTQLVRSLTANQKVLGSIPRLVEGSTLGDLLLPHHPWRGH